MSAKESVKRAEEAVLETLIESESFGDKKRKLSKLVEGAYKSLVATDKAKRDLTKEIVDSKLVPKSQLAEALEVSESKITTWSK